MNVKSVSLLNQDKIRELSVHDLCVYRWKLIAISFAIFICTIVTSFFYSTFLQKRSEQWQWHAKPRFLTYYMHSIKKISLSLSLPLSRSFSLSLPLSLSCKHTHTHTQIHFIIHWPYIEFDIEIVTSHKKLHTHSRIRKKDRRGKG